MTEPKRPTCATCPYWVKGSKTNGACRVNPPQVSETDDDYYASWPFVEPDEWCGKHPEFQDWMDGKAYRIEPFHPGALNEKNE